MPPRHLQLLLCALAPTSARALSFAELDSVETITIWSAILVMHLVLAAAFCCCERPMTDPIRMREQAGVGGGATARPKRESAQFDLTKRGSTRSDGQPMKSSMRTARNTERRQ